MVVTKDDDGYWVSLQGTLAEVLAALKSNNVRPQHIIGFGYDTTNTNWACIYWKG